MDFEWIKNLKKANASLDRILKEGVQFNITIRFQELKDLLSLLKRKSSNKKEKVRSDYDG